MSHIQKILVPLDGSPSSIEALSRAVALAEDMSATVEVLHVDTPGEALAPAKTAQAEAERAMEEAIAAAESRLGDKLGRRIESGDPVRKIIEVAASEDADMIVLGTHGRVGRLHALVGSVAEGVVRSAPCPVLTVRRPDGEEETFSERVHAREPIAHQTQHDHARSR